MPLAVGRRFPTQLERPAYTSDLTSVVRSSTFMSCADIKENEILSFLTTWMDPEGIMLNEMS